MSPRRPTGADDEQPQVIATPAPVPTALLTIHTPVGIELVAKLLAEMPPEATMHASTGAIEVRARRAAP